MKAADTQATNLYGDLNMIFQQSIDMARRDAADRVSAVPRKVSTAWILWLLKALTAMVLVLFLLDMFAFSGWAMVYSPAVVRDLIIVAVSAAVLIGLDIWQRRLGRRTRQ